MPAKLPEDFSSQVVGWSVDDLYQLVDPAFMAREAARVGLSTQKWLGKANLIRWPIGAYPGKVGLLMRRQSLNKMDVDDFHTVRISSGTDTIEFVNLLITREPVSICPGEVRDHDEDVYYVEMSDARYLAQNRYFGAPINRQYNVRCPDGGTLATAYYSGTLNSGSLWTWQTMLDDVWSYIGVTELGDSPTLPFTPDGTPEDFKFVGVYAWSAYNAILKRIGCSFVLHPDGTTEIVRTGEDDTDFDAAVLEFESRVVSHDNPIQIVRAKVPAEIDVYFHKYFEHYGTEPTTAMDSTQYTTDSVHVVTVTLPTSLGVDDDVYSGSRMFVWDDLKAIVDIDGDLTNESDLDARADERANDIWRMIYSGGDRFSKLYAGFVSDTRLFLGSQVSGIGWYDVGDGPRTEVFNSAATFLIDDGGSWVETGLMPSQENLANPDYARATFPNYPITDQVIHQVSSTPDPATGFYDGYLVTPRVPDKTLPHAERVWIWNPNG